MSNCAVLFLVFNRPELTRRVLAAIREARPPRLYVAADGPRQGNEGDLSATAAVRAAVLEGVDWQCEIKTLFRDENLGCGLAVSSAISWFFEQEKMGVILEDDCLPGPDFFPYCEELLERYRDDDRVLHIGGSSNLVDVNKSDSYFFSRYPKVWGWASWRRAWKHFSLNRPDYEFGQVAEYFSSAEEQAYWRIVLGQYFGGEIDTWDYPWAFSVWKARGMSIHSTRDLVKNIGFGPEALHTKYWRDYRGMSDFPLEAMGSMRHPAMVTIDDECDRMVFDQHFRPVPMPIRISKAARRALTRRFKRR